MHVTENEFRLEMTQKPRHSNYSVTDSQVDLRGKVSLPNFTPELKTRLPITLKTFFNKFKTQTGHKTITTMTLGHVFGWLMLIMHTYTCNIYDMDYFSRFLIQLKPVSRRSIETTSTINKINKLQNAPVP